MRTKASAAFFWVPEPCSRKGDETCMSIYMRTRSETSSSTLVPANQVTEGGYRDLSRRRGSWRTLWHKSGVTGGRGSLMHVEAGVDAV